MAVQQTGAPSWVAAFQNILNLEESRGFDNKAVMGGLDKFVARWTDEMAGQAVNDESFLLKKPYDSMSEKLRAQWVARWQEALIREPDLRMTAGQVATPRKEKSAARKAVV